MYVPQYLLMKAPGVRCGVAAASPFEGRCDVALSDRHSRDTASPLVLSMHCPVQVVQHSVPLRRWAAPGGIWTATGTRTASHDCDSTLRLAIGLRTAYRTGIKRQEHPQFWALWSRVGTVHVHGQYLTCLCCCLAAAKPARSLARQHLAAEQTVECPTDTG